MNSMVLVCGLLETLDPGWPSVGWALVDRRECKGETSKSLEYRKCLDVVPVSRHFCIQGILSLFLFQDTFDCGKIDSSIFQDPLVQHVLQGIRKVSKTGETKNLLITAGRGHLIRKGQNDL